MSHILADLNSKQLEAVTTISGPLLIIAGAGSGKTRALTHRIAYTIKEKNINPKNILAVTFTNKAAMEMKLRLIKLLSGKHEISLDLLKLSGRVESEKCPYSFLPTVGTFHSVCVQILRKHIHLIGFENAFTIYDTADQKALMKTLMEEEHLDEKQYNPMAILNHISNAKNELIGPKEYQNFALNYFNQIVARMYETYQRALKRNNALDFDDLIMKTVELFQKIPDILDEYQERFQYISVDEYQDTNHSQYVLMKKLAEKYRNICVIGDEDQSIYSWRGADIRNILDFEKDYKDAKVIKLEQNYRSSQIILDAAHHIIMKNKKRKEKKLWTEKKEGPKIRLYQARNEREEGELIAREIMEKVKTHEYPTYTDFVVLYRTNAQSRVLEEVFMRFSIPYRIVGGVKFYERKEIKDILAYLRVVQNPLDFTNLMRIINTPPRNIGGKTLEAINTFMSQTGMNFFEALKQVESIEELNDGKKQTLQSFMKMWQEFFEANKEFTASGVIKTILARSGYKDFLLSDQTEEGEVRFENVRELVSVASKYDGLAPGISLATFLEEVSLIADLDTIDPRSGSDSFSERSGKDNAVTLMTIHAAKGLEFPCVFICGLEEGLFPHSRSLFDPEQLEEERRLMYVALTRAKEDLFLLHALQRLLYGETLTHEPSQFLPDIPEELIVRNKSFSYMKPFSSMKPIDPKVIGKKPVPVESLENSLELKDGDKVSHKTWGNGLVLNVLGGIATIVFENPKIGVKKLAISVAPLEKIY